MMSSSNYATQETNYLFWKRFAQGKLKTHVSSVKVRIPSPKEILSWSERRLPNSTLVGKIDNAHTVEHDTLRPVSGGLFCERIFGPMATNVCACLRKKGWNEDFCKTCEVQFTKSRLRRYQMGHILLSAPVIHIWALQGGYLATLLGKKNFGIRSIAYGKVMCQAKPKNYLFSENPQEVLQPVHTKGNCPSPSVRGVRGKEDPCVKTSVVRSPKGKGTLLMKENNPAREQPPTSAAIPCASYLSEGRAGKQPFAVPLTSHLSEGKREIEWELSTSSKNALSNINLSTLQNSERSTTLLFPSPLGLLASFPPPKAKGSDPFTYGTIFGDKKSMVPLPLALRPSFGQERGKGLRASRQRQFRMGDASKQASTPGMFSLALQEAREKWNNNQGPPFLAEKLAISYSLYGKKYYEFRKQKHLEKRFIKNSKHLLYVRGNVLPFYQFILYKPDTFKKISQFFESSNKQKLALPIINYSIQKINLPFFYKESFNTFGKDKCKEKNTTFLWKRNPYGFTNTYFLHSNFNFSNVSILTSTAFVIATVEGDSNLNYSRDYESKEKQPCFCLPRASFLRTGNKKGRQAQHEKEPLSQNNCIKHENLHTSDKANGVLNNFSTLVYIHNLHSKVNINFARSRFCLIPQEEIFNTENFGVFNGLDNFNWATFHSGKLQEQGMVDMFTSLHFSCLKENVKKRLNEPRMSNNDLCAFLCLPEATTSLLAIPSEGRAPTAYPSPSEGKEQLSSDRQLGVGKERTVSTPESNSFIFGDEKKVAYFYTRGESFFQTRKHGKAPFNLFKDKTFTLFRVFSNSSAFSSAVFNVKATSMDKEQNQEFNRGEESVKAQFKLSNIVPAESSLPAPKVRGWYTLETIDSKDKQIGTSSFLVPKKTLASDPCFYTRGQSLSPSLQDLFSVPPHLRCAEHWEKGFLLSLGVSNPGVSVLPSDRKGLLSFGRTTGSNPEKDASKELSSMGWVACFPEKDATPPLWGLASPPGTQEAAFGGPQEALSNQRPGLQAPLTEVQKKDVRDDLKGRKQTKKSKIKLSNGASELFSCSGGRLAKQVLQAPFPMRPFSLPSVMRQESKRGTKGEGKSSQQPLFYENSFIPNKDTVSYDVRTDSPGVHAKLSNYALFESYAPCVQKVGTTLEIKNPGATFLSGENFVKYGFTGPSVLLQSLKNLNLILLEDLVNWKWEQGKTRLNSFLLQKKLTKKKRGLRNKLAKTKIVLTRRKKLIQSFLKTKQLPEWMVLLVLPVLPPALRPILELEPNNVVVSDLNVLYQTVIRRNDALMGLLTFRALEIDILSRQVSLQQAIEKLFDKGAGTKKRPLKSLSQGFHGKKGLFRLHLLGKRVDYSGRSVIVVGPQLKLHECGLPKEMALVLFLPFLIARLKKNKIAHNTSKAKQLIIRKDKQIWRELRALIYEHPVLLNRAPTLHRLGFQAFQPILVSGKAIILPALVCTGFNADFDGDQMAVHVPLSYAARAESWKLLYAKNNMLSPATGKSVISLSQEMILGCYSSSLLINKTHSLSALTSFTHTVNMSSGRSIEKGVPVTHAFLLQREGNKQPFPKGTRLSSVPFPSPSAQGSKRGWVACFPEGDATPPLWGLASPPGTQEAGFDGTQATPFPCALFQRDASLPILFPFGTRSKHPSFGQDSNPLLRTTGQQAWGGDARQAQVVGQEITCFSQHRKEKLYFTTFQDIHKALNQNKIALQTPIWLRLPLFEDNGNLEEPLEIRLNTMGHFFRLYGQSQRYFSNKIKSKNQTLGISYIRTSAGRIQLNETFYSSIRK